MDTTGKVFSILSNYWYSASLNVFCKLGVADLFPHNQNNPLSVLELLHLNNLSWQIQPLERLLLYLSSNEELKILTVSYSINNSDKYNIIYKFILTPEGELFKKNNSSCLYSICNLEFSNIIYSAHCLYSDMIIGEFIDPKYYPLKALIEKSSDNYTNQINHQSIHNVMQCYSIFEARTLLNDCKELDLLLKEQTVFCDIGDSIGEFTAQIAQNYRDIDTVIFTDDSSKIRITQYFMILEPIIKNKISLYSGNYLDITQCNSITPNNLLLQYDHIIKSKYNITYHMKHIFHNLSDDDSVSILKKFLLLFNNSNSHYANINLLITEHHLDNSHSSKNLFCRGMDIHMNTVTGGKQRTINEFKTILFKLSEVDLNGLNWEYCGIYHSTNPICTVSIIHLKLTMN